MSKRTVTDLRKQPGSAKDKPKEYEERVVQINRVAKVIKGGRKMSFNALVVVGNKQGKVGVGLGKANEVKEAVRKGVDKAKKKMLHFSIKNDTIPFEITYKFKSAKIFMKPAAEGTGVIAGGATRIVLELLGIRNILTKQIGSNNQINNAYGALQALKQLEKQAEIKRLREKIIKK